MGGGGSSGGGGGTTQSVSNSYSSLSPWIAPYVTSMLGAAQQQVFNTDPTTGQITSMNPYQAYGSINPQTGQQYGMSTSDMAAANASVAPFSQLQNQSFQGAGNLQTPGQFGQATGAAGMGTMQSLMAGQNLANQSTNPNAVGAYMNPYIQNALNPALQLANQQYGIAGTQMAGQATGAGAFGGSRNALQQNLNAQNQMLAQNQLIGNAYNTAYTNAQNQMNTVANVGLQGANQGIAGANTLANIGTGQLGAQQNILNQQNTLGQQQTAGTQAIINQAMQNYQTGQQYPMQQLTNLKNLASGIPVTDTTQTIQQAAPSTANLIGGAGMTLLGAGLAGSGGSNVTINNPAPVKSAQGGIMKLQTKKYSNGGIGSIYRKALNDPASVPNQSLQDGTINGLPAQLVQAMKLNEQQQAQAPAQAPTSTVIQDIDAKAAQQQAQEQQIDEQKLLAQLPTIMADLKVARDIAKEKGDKEELKAIDTKISEISMLAQRAQEKMQMQPAQPPQVAQGPLAAPAPQGIEAAMAQQQQAAQQPQQMAQAAPQQAPQGIAQFYKGGEVKRYEVGGVPLISPDITNWLSDKANTIGSALQNVGNIKPVIRSVAGVDNTAPTTWADEADQPMTPGRATPENHMTTAEIAAANPPKITIGPRGGPSVKASDAAKELNIAQYDVKGATNDVTSMIKNWSDMLMGQYNKDTSLQDIGRGLMHGGARWAGYTGAGTGLGQGIAGFGEGYAQSLEASEAKKDKMLTQLMSLGLSGAQLKMEAAKLGIAQEELKAKLPVLAGQAALYRAKANAPIGGVGLVAPGPINPSDLMKIDQRFDALKNNPKSDPAFYNSLPPAVQKQLDLPKDSAGYKTGMQNVEKIVQDQKDTFIQRAHREGARYKTSRSSSDLDE